MGCYNDTLPSLTQKQRERDEEIDEILVRVKEIIGSGETLPEEVTEFVMDSALNRRR